MSKTLLPGSIRNHRPDRRLLFPLLCTALFLGALSITPEACAQAAPQLVSVTPANGAANAAVNSSLIFVFDQEMDTNVTVVPGFPPFLVGNLEVTPPNHYVSGTWSDDGRTLTCAPSSPLPANSSVTWKLNPPDNAFPFTSADGTDLATVSGSFSTGAGDGGGNGCDQNPLPSDWGSYSISKSGDYEQTSAADPVPVADSPFLFGAFVKGPSSGPAVTAASVTLPNNTRKDLQGFGPFFSFSDSPPTEPSLDAAYPPGNYTLRFTQTGQPERVIPMNMPATKPPVPKITNFPEAQAVNAGQNFTLSWGAFTGAVATDYINLLVVDDQGKVIFQAPDRCVPRELPVTATSIVIPANTLKPNLTYSATLSFSRSFYSSTNTVPQMSGFGGLMRTTHFTIKTGSGGGTGPVAATLTRPRLLPTGDTEISLTGSPTRVYTIQRTGNLKTLNWTAAGTVSTDASGKAVFQDTQPNKIFPLFYRAVAN